MGHSKYTPDRRTYSKVNFVDLLETITPEIYKTEDINLSGFEVNPISEVVNSHVRACANIPTVLSVSAVANSPTDTINNISGISCYFIKQHELTKVTPFSFESDFLLPLNTTLRNYDTSSEFIDYLSGTFLPQIVLASDTDAAGINNNITTLSAIAGSSDASAVHNALLSKLGWFYLLNTSAEGGLAWEPSGYVLSSLATLHSGKSLGTLEGVRGFTEFVWRNYETCTPFQTYNLIPGTFVSGAADAITDISAGTLPTYTSGTQKLDKLLTLIDVIYSPAFMDQEDYRVKTAIQDYIDAGTELSDLVSEGPLRKFQTMLGFSIADRTSEIEDIGLIYDIENAKEEHLQYIADLIGWKLRGRSAAKWRHQLRNAVSLYKKSGTLAAVQGAINALITETVFDVSGQVQELWESYIPFLIWYALGTESPLFKDLTTWTPGLAQKAVIGGYSVSSFEENLQLVTDSILLDLYKAFPENFVFDGQKWAPPRLYELNEFGCSSSEIYTIINEPGQKPIHYHDITSDGYQAFKQDAKLHGEFTAWEAAEHENFLGFGVFMAGDEHFAGNERPKYLISQGCGDFVFNYRGRKNFPIPPFEEVKFYRDCTVTAELVELLVEKLKCFKVREAFADQVGDYLMEHAVDASSNLGSLNEFLLLFSGVEIPPNYTNVLDNNSQYQKNLLPLWNGKSSHLFIDFDNTDFDFSKTTLEGDSRYAVYEAARVTKEFSPANAITRVNLNASAEDGFDYSSTIWNYVNPDKEDNRAGYTSASILGNYEHSGVAMGTVSPGDSAGRGGLNTFWRESVDDIHQDSLFSSTTAITGVGRRALRRRNFRYLLPREGYYDRTGFNGPVSWDASTLENSMASSLGELTLGYVASAGKFHPVEDPIEPSGVWHRCETTESSRAFSGVDTSTTFPYRGLSSVALNNNAKWNEFAASTTHYVDRGQTPPIYITMHNLFEQKARDHAFENVKLTDSEVNREDVVGPWDYFWMQPDHAQDAYWKSVVQSYANEAIASGLLLNSFDEYINFSFGTGLQRAYEAYTNEFGRHSLGLAEVDKTGGNIFAHVFGKGLYNCDFDIAGSAATTLEGNYIASSFSTAVPITYNGGSGVFSTCAVAAYGNGHASGTYIASDAGEMLIPITGSFSAATAFNAEFRNPHILSGVEFVQPSGAPSSNEFRIFKIDPTLRVVGEDDYLINNTIIKCKTDGGLPRLRFDLSGYGERVNKLVKDHHFQIKVKAITAEEDQPTLGGGKIGVWIHTGTLTPSSNQMWSWTPKKKWTLHEESDLSQQYVLGSLAHLYEFGPIIPSEQDSVCLKTILEKNTVNDVKLNSFLEEYFQTFTLDFDTRNFTIYNNYEYLDVIPVPEEYYKNKELVHTSSTDYYVEVFFVPPNNPKKYMVLDSVELQDLTLRDQAALPTGHGVRTKGIPLRPFVKEDKIYLEKDNLRDVFKFYNGLIGSGVGLYATNLASRDSSLTSNSLEVSGGSRLNYRIHPDWEPNTKQATYNNYESVEFNN